jgi:hypothetical protein
MKSLSTLLFGLFLFAAMNLIGGAPARAANNDSGLTIRVSESGWGQGSTQDIQKVLYSAASEILAYVPSKQGISIIVRRTEGTPITLYERGPNNEYIVLLNSKDTYWSQYAYQFSHEFCHVIAMNSKVTDDPNQWFEESLGETASMFALKKMAASWETSPPYPNWKDYAGSLRSYVQDLMAESHRRLPSDTTLAQWFDENETSLRANPYLRRKDELVANQLLTLFENDPEGWGAVAYLNMTQPNRKQTFAEYLKAWHNRVPRRYEPFVESVAQLFGVSI